jgi:hypothetical protein
MAEIAIMFFGREVTLQSVPELPARFEAKLAPTLTMVWADCCLRLIANGMMVEPSAASETADRAAVRLEASLEHLRPLFTPPPAVHTGPVPMALQCPKCSAEHIDQGEWATTREHKTHLCSACNHEWRPCDFATVGVATGESEADVSYFDGGHDGPGWYYWDSQHEDEGTCGAFESFEEAARHAAISYHRVLPPLMARSS